MTRKSHSIFALLFLCFTGCDAKVAPPLQSPKRSVEIPDKKGVDSALAKQIFAKYQCVRCHEIATLERPKLKNDCVRCHQSVEQETFDADPDFIAEWKTALRNLPHAPSLSFVGDTLREDWLLAFITNPHDLRPNLGASMPRLLITPDEARIVVTYLRSIGKSPVVEEEKQSYSETKIGEGKTIFESLHCGDCHSFRSVIRGKKLKGSKIAAEVLAPDLAHVRDRMTDSTLKKWLSDPSSLKPDTSMPNFGLNEKDILSLSAFIMGSKSEKKHAALPKRLPLLSRTVSYEEVDKRVFKKICWHCHSDPAYVEGDGGPGNTGGFGYQGIGLSFATYAEVMSGYRKEDGSFASLFENAPNSKLINALLARQKEEQGEGVPGVLGMPLGFPSLPPEDIQLLETWIAQGRLP